MLVLGLTVVGPALASAGVAFPFVDMNSNGVYDPGVDSGDITADLLSGDFATSESVVIPADVRGLTTKSLKGFKISAAKGIAVLANLSVSTDGGITLLADAGAVVIGDKKVLKAGFVLVDARHEVTVGRGAIIEAKGGPVAGSGYVTLSAVEGDLLLLGGARVNARDDIQLFSWEGTVTALPAVQITSNKGLVNIRADGDVVLSAVKVRGEYVNVYTFGNLVQMDNSVMRAPRNPGWISVVASGEDSTIDCSGTRWEGVSPANVLVSADTVIHED